MCEHTHRQGDGDAAVYMRVAAHIDNKYNAHTDGRRYEYGTAGFRAPAARLPCVVARVACIAALRACYVACASAPPQCIGIVVTASHNPPSDNGIKIVDADGGMLLSAWELWCTRAANAHCGSDVVAVMSSCAAAFLHYGDTCLQCQLRRSVVRLARDTRPSGVLLVGVLQDVLAGVLGVRCIDHGVVTTPQLHDAVARANRVARALTSADGLAACRANMCVALDSTTPAALLGNLYLEQLCVAYDSLSSLLFAGHGDSEADAAQCRTSPRQQHHAYARRRVVVDAANGVGALTLRNLMAWAVQRGGLLTQMLDIVIVNDSVDDAAALNDACGADAAKTTGQPSAAMLAYAEEHDAGEADDEVHYYCLDGDADRLIAFCHTPTRHTWQLLDGDRIAILYMLLIQHMLTKTMKRTVAVPTTARTRGVIVADGDKLDKGDCDARTTLTHGVRVGMIQTAYANGAARTYVERVLHVPVCVSKTGVKHLHHAAQQYDVGVYFEANGHGTVLCNLPRIAVAASMHTACAAQTNNNDNDTSPSPLSDAWCVHACTAFATLCSALSQVCGDAIADMLVVDIALRALRLRVCDWASLYTDLAVVQRKVSVTEPHRIVCCDEDESRARAPMGLQEDIDSVVAQHGIGARAFARPSGTEAVVRVYAEATTVDICNQLAEQVTNIVKKYCNRHD